MMGKKDSPCPSTYEGIYPTLGTPFDFKKKSKSVEYYVRTALIKFSQVFKVKNLPETMPERNIKLMLLSLGSICVTDKDLKGLYGFRWGYSGTPDPYYMPTESVVTNPALKYDKTLAIGKDCVIVRNDSQYMGILPVLRRYATLLAENDLTINQVQKNTRIPFIMAAGDDVAAENARLFLKRVDEGEIGIIGTTAYNWGTTDDEAVKITPTAGNTGIFTPLIELQQYLKASMLNDLGIQANWNAKREAIMAGESKLNDDGLFPQIDDMYANWKEGFDEVNKKYGTDIQVEFASIWEDNQKEAEAALDMLEAEVSKVEAEAEKIENDEKGESVDDSTGTSEKTETSDSDVEDNRSDI